MDFAHQWPYLGLLLALFLLWWLIKTTPTTTTYMHDPSVVLGFIWPMYLIHQFEEHGIDMKGKRYSFQQHLCTSLGYATPTTNCPADDNFIMCVNVVACQINCAIAWWYRHRQHHLISACGWGVALINGLLHVILVITSGMYNPGALTAAIFFIPLSIWMLATVLSAGIVKLNQVHLIIVTGIVIHVVLAGSLQMYARGYLPYTMMLLVNCLNGLWLIPISRIGT